jgi:hypothetical protein
VLLVAYLSGVFILSFLLAAAMDQIAENYQLKWHSFGTYLHSCIATSLQNESFADVALVTIDGRQIMAHRFVLSACSQYLHQILKLQPRVTTALPLMIILPPEINYRTMKTLIQYMYSGEATVSKDILEPVLRGGDILKVKGLWRPKEDENNDNRLVKVSHKNDKSKQAAKPDQKESPEAANSPPKVLNYTINVMKTYEGKSDGKDKQVKPAEEKKKPKNNQNSVIKSTEEEKRAQKNDSEESEKAEQSNDSLQFLVIKEEPIEWSEVNDAEMELVDEKEVFSTEMTIKPEIYMEDGEEQGLYSPLTCELCTETFTLPAEWVRHVQTHTDMLPAKRQRRGKSSQVRPFRDHKPRGIHSFSFAGRRNRRTFPPAALRPVSEVLPHARRMGPPHPEHPHRVRAAPVEQDGSR